MAIVQNFYTGNGATVLFPFSFSYLDQSHVFVEVNGTGTTAFTFANASTIEFNTAPANGAAIRIFRSTDIDNPEAVFSPGSSIRASDLNQNNTQLIFSAQETAQGTSDANTTAASAVSTANAAVVTANAADAKADTAIIDSAAAVVTANTAESNSLAAVNTANLAESNSLAAVSTANAASAAVAAAVIYQPVVDLAALALLTPTDGKFFELQDSTGADTDPSITGVPVGIVGAAGLTFRLRYDDPPGEYVFLGYFASDSETRYLKIGVGQIVDADVNASAAIADTKLATIATAGKVSNSATTADSANTASAIVARDASGNFTAGTITATGDLVVPSINGGPLAGFRNAIINGNFDIWQRGTSFTGAKYGADRWLNERTGTTHTVTREAFTLGQTDVPGEPTYFHSTVVASVAGAGNNANLQQRIEDVRTFAGQQVTISFWAKADATKNIALDFVQNFGTGGSPSAAVDGIGVSKVSIGTSWQKVTVTATLPSISGKTLGTDNNDTLRFRIWFDAGSDFDAQTDSLGQQSGTFDIAQVQVEPGPVATPFERRPQQTELALCQRYFQIGAAHDGGANALKCAAGNAGSNRFNAAHSFATEMRTEPNVTVSSINFVNCSDFGIQQNGTGGFSTIVASDATQFYRASGYDWTADAEL